MAFVDEVDASTRVAAHSRHKPLNKQRQGVVRDNEDKNNRTKKEQAAFKQAARSGNEALGRFKQTDTMRLVDQILADMRPLAKDEVEAASIAADLFMLHAFATRSRRATDSGQPAPAMPSFTSELARGLIRRSQLLLVSLANTVTEVERERLIAILEPLLQGGEKVTPAIVDTVAALLTMDPEDATFWIRMGLNVGTEVAS